MSVLLSAINQFALELPECIAIEGLSQSISYEQLPNSIETIASFLIDRNVACVGLLMDNTPATLIVDLACIKQAVTLIPVPLFFSPEQLSHGLKDSAADTLFSNLGEKTTMLLQYAGIEYKCLAELCIAGEQVQVYDLNTSAATSLIHENHAKITYTSGSTGAPKGVCLSQFCMDRVANSLKQATNACSTDKHLCLLPYATLLENIAGMYTPLLSGATVCLPGLAQVGVQGSSSFDVLQCVKMMRETAATTCVMIPQMLHALVTLLEAGQPKLETLRYIAVGGAPVSKALLLKAECLGLTVYEGYGLSEAASVVTLNTIDAKRLGSVGRPLPHVQLEIASDGEILLHGMLFSGYLGSEASNLGVWHTGDMGYIDQHGYLFIKGRKKHIFITSFGRNVSPEWVEKELNIEPAIAQSCVFGEGQSFNIAVVSLRQGFELSALEAAFSAANMRLPDYAQVHRWIVTDVPFSVDNGQWTGTGRPRRKFIEQYYHQALQDMYRNG
ncbi:MAG: AMP-binding protein [Mariprofundaceae bacterium]